MMMVSTSSAGISALSPLVAGPGKAGRTTLIHRK
jgi:hypothetical protein